MLINLLNGEITQQDYCYLNNIKIIYKKLPKKIYGFIHRYRDINIIIINWNISKEKKQHTLLHEFAHMELNHLDKNILEFKLESIEDEADKYINELKKYYNIY